MVEKNKTKNKKKIEKMETIKEEEEIEFEEDHYCICTKVIEFF